VLIRDASQVSQVRAAIAQGLYPKMITTGSSGSYFARARIAVPRHGSSSKTDTVVTTLAVFKPKDEEPYGNLKCVPRLARSLPH
jgi:hypothetical protein